MLETVNSAVTGPNGGENVRDNRTPDDEPKPERRRALKLLDPNIDRDLAYGCRLSMGCGGSSKYDLLHGLLASHRRTWNYAVAFGFPPCEEERLGSVIPDSFIHPRFDDGVLENVVAMMAQAISRGARRTLLVLMGELCFRGGESAFGSAALRRLCLERRMFAADLYMTMDVADVAAPDFPEHLRCGSDRAFVVGGEELHRHEDSWAPFLDAMGVPRGEALAMLGCCESDQGALVAFPRGGLGVGGFGGGDGDEAEERIRLCPLVEEHDRIPHRALNSNAWRFHRAFAIGPEGSPTVPAPGDAPSVLSSPRCV